MRFGFEEVGSWNLADEGIQCDLHVELDPKQALLAYAMGENVVYIGRAHRAAGKAGYVGRSIRNALARDKQIKVFALLEWEPFDHCGLTVNVAAGVEDELVDRMQPPWNNYPG